MKRDVTLGEYLDACRILGKEIDIDVDGVEGGCIAYCGTELTEEGRKHFTKALKLPMYKTSQGEVCSSVISNNDEDYDNIYDDYGYFNLKNPLALAWSMLSGMAGYCSCENYDKWFCAE